MSSEYVQPEEYPYYGFPDGTTAQQVRRASTMIDNMLDRPEGLVWAPDSVGRPCYMTALTPPAGDPLIGRPVLVAPITPGTSIVITFAYPTYDLIGEVFILDRSDPSLCEAVTVSGVDLINNTVTLGRVIKPHAAGAVLEAGLVILEERALPARRSLARVARPNLAGLLSVVGRYGYGRRSDQYRGYGQDLGLIMSLQALGGLDTWQPIDAATCSFSNVTGEIWIMPGLMGEYSNEVRLRFVAGFPAGAIPDAVKNATASLVINQASAEDNGLSSVFKMLAAGGTKMERFGDSIFDSDTKDALSTHKLRIMV